MAGSPAAIQNTPGLKAPGGGVTTITSSGVDSNGVGFPLLLLDLGANVGGYVEIGIGASDGTPIRLGLSETLDHMTPKGDIPGAGLSFGLSDDPEGRTALPDHRAGAVPLARDPRSTAPDRASARGRRQCLDRLRARADRAPASEPCRYGGYFYSSDPLLNRIWFASAYTFAMNSVRDLRPDSGSAERS